MITTFYADRAGDRRPVLLADTATRLASWGYRVLCVDWDLSGAGVTGFLGAPPAAGGLVDLVRDGGDTGPPEAFTRTVPSRDGRLDLIRPYGRKSAPDPVDWVGLHRDRDLGDYLEACAEQWRQDYDAVLVDAPTGTGPAAGICLAHLPDALVPLVRPDGQQDTATLLDRVAAARDRLPYDRGRVLTVPWLSEGRLAPALTVAVGAWVDRDLPVDRLTGLLAEQPAILAALLAAELEDNGDLKAADTTDEYLRRAATGTFRAAERLAGARRSAREALEKILVAILPAEDWAGIELSVLALKDTLDSDDPGAIAVATRRLPAIGFPVRGPRMTAIPDRLRAEVSGLLGALR